MYIRERYTPVATPVKQLRGFERVQLNPGETKAVTMSLTPEDLRLLDLDMHWKVVPGTFDVMIGKSSGNIVLSEPLQVSGPRLTAAQDSEK
jgi:beta-glucosidase